ncbi:hypothetical protein BDV39DRAFT_182263 [Aspergillus sergii]|uniref:Uncharacterized protein n=1 Tax=Aspergillus sergii TaxID=1034303 RepID=A0A5N6WRQ6_9EURO|nr:hypothetical protein BDV39DRAFT_182263 [Aspergillus sergii]
MVRRLHTDSVAGLKDGPTAVCKGYHCALKPMGNSVGAQSIRTQGSCQFLSFRIKVYPFGAANQIRIQRIHVVAMGLSRVRESLGHAEARHLPLQRPYRYVVAGGMSLEGLRHIHHFKLCFHLRHVLLDHRRPNLQQHCRYGDRCTVITDRTLNHLYGDSVVLLGRLSFRREEYMVSLWHHLFYVINRTAIQANLFILS